jgi:hypothetical protein
LFATIHSLAELIPHCCKALSAQLYSLQKGTLSDGFVAVNRENISIESNKACTAAHRLTVANPVSAGATRWPGNCQAVQATFERVNGRNGKRLPSGKVVAIRRKPTRSPGCDRALALLIEAQSILAGLLENGEVESGSPPGATLWYLDDAIGMLAPFTPEEEKDEGDVLVRF